MAAGDITWFNAAKAFDYFAGWAGTDTIKVALITSATAPAATDITPALADYTEVTPGGAYAAAGGESLDTWANMWNDPTAGGTGTFDDTGASVVWSQNASSPTNARYAIIHNDAQGDAALAFIDLGAVVDMTAGDLTITWNASGIATVTSA